MATIPAASSLPPEVLFVAVVVFGVLGLVGVIALAMVALRPTKIKASHGGKIDYSPRAKLEVSRPPTAPTGGGT